MVLVRFSGNRQAYTQALANYADANQNHSGVAGVIYRDQAYSQLVQSADDLLKSLKSLDEYLLETGIAVNPDTVAIDSTLRSFSDAKGYDLHSVIDHLYMTGITADQLKILSQHAKQNGDVLQGQITAVQQMLIDKGATLRVAHMPE